MTPKKALCIHDLSTVGRSSLRIITPTISRLGTQVIALPTAVVAVSPEAKNLANGCWKTITAKLNITKHRLYRKPGPVLTVISMEDATAPEQPVATFF